MRGPVFYTNTVTEENSSFFLSLRGAHAHMVTDTHAHTHIQNKRLPQGKLTQCMLNRSHIVSSEAVQGEFDTVLLLGVGGTNKHKPLQGLIKIP